MNVSIVSDFHSGNDTIWQGGSLELKEAERRWGDQKGDSGRIGNEDAARQSKGLIL